MRARVLPWLFALALLVGQAAAFAHSLTHAHDPALPDHVCEVCIGQAQLGGAVPPTVLTPAAETVRCDGPTSTEAPASVACARSALARAPPAAR
jgi:hypothetical protein